MSPDLVTSESTYRTLLEEAVRRHGAREAYRCLGVSLSYRALGRASEAFASWLADAGLVRGDRVAVMLPNLLSFPVAALGVLRGGYVLTCVNPLYTPRELARQIADAGAKVLVVLEADLGTVAEAFAGDRPPTVVAVRVGDLMGWRGRVADVVARRRTPRPSGGRHARELRALPFTNVVRRRRIRPGAIEHPAPDDLALLQYTGGTTGVSKGAMIRHRNILANVEQVNTRFAGVLAKLSNPPRIVTALPLYHAMAFITCLTTMLALGGSCLLIPDPRDLRGFVRTLRHERFSLFVGVNSLYQGLLAQPDIAKVDFSDLVASSIGGSATQAPVANRWLAVTGGPLIGCYGMSETTAVVSIDEPVRVRPSTTSGAPLSRTEVEIRSMDGASLGPCEPGEIHVRGPQVTSGYWNEPEATAATLGGDGFLATGDIGMLDTDGRLVLLDRVKDMILVSGFNVYPNEVEDVIAGLPGVCEVAVVGVPDARSAEAPVAFVVARGELTELAILDHCRAQLAAYKRPRHVVFTDALPKTPVGKVLRRELRALAAARFAPAAASAA